MSGFDILSLVGEPWNEGPSLFRGIGVTVTDVASLPSSKFLEFVLNGSSIYSVLKTGETIISDATGASLGGLKLAGSAGEMALTSQIDTGTGMPAETLRYAWEDTAHVGNDPLSGAVLQGMGASNFSIESPATITHIAGNSTYAWAGMVGARLFWSGYEAATTNGKTIDFTNVGQATRASPILSVSAANVADDLIHFGLSDGTNWSIAAKVDAAGRGQFQMLDLPEQGAPGDPAAGSARIYGLSVGGTTKIAFRDSAGAETVLGSTLSISGGTVTANTPVVDFSQTWNESSTSFSAISATITDTNSAADSTLIKFNVGAGPVYQVRKTGETVISNAAGTSLGGVKLAGSDGEMALTSQIETATSAPAEVLRYSWKDPAHVGSSDAESIAVLRGMGASDFSIEGPATISHVSGTSSYAWTGVSGDRLAWSGMQSGTTTGKTFDFTNVGQTPVRASPIASFSAQDVADDLVHFGTSDGTTWSVAAKVDAAGRGQFQMLDLPEQGTPGDPATGSARVYSLNVGGATKIAFRDSSGAETVLGSTVSITSGTVTANTPVINFSQTWNESSTSFSAIAATITDTNSAADSTLIKFNVGAGPVYQVRKTGETVISNAAGTSLGGVKLAGSAGEMALTSQTDTATSAPAEVLRYSWKDAAHVGSSDSASVAVLRGMGASDFSIEGPATIAHVSGNSTYAWTGVSGDRLLWSGTQTGTTTGKTFDFTNFGQTPLRASPIASFSAQDAADDLVHFGTTDGTVWTVAAKVDAAGRGQFQMLDLPQQATPGDPAAGSARIYGKTVSGITKVAFRDSTGAETVLGSYISVAGGTVTANTPLAAFSQTWNASNIAFSAITANITNTASSATSTLLSLTVNSDPVFQVRKTGEMLIHNAGGTPFMTLTGDLDDGKVPGNSRTFFHGIVVNWNRNNIGGGIHPQLELKVEGKTYWQISTDTRDVSENGGLGPQMRFIEKNDATKYWAIEYNANGGVYTVSNGVRMCLNKWDGPPGQVAEYVWTVTNRVTFESRATFVHIAYNGRFEWETAAVGGTVASRVAFVGFFAGTAIGTTIDFNNYGQTPARASPVVSISVENPADDPLHIGKIDINGWTTYARFDGVGKLYSPGVSLAGTTGTQPGLSAKLNTDTQNRISVGLDANDLGVLKFGAGGSTAQDLTLSRDIIPGTLGINNGTSAATLRIYRTYANGGTDSEQWNLSWRSTTLVPWASIRTGSAGTGVRRNICIEPTLLGIGIPIGDGSNIPALKNVSGMLQIRKGDDSNFAAIKGKLTTESAAQSETIVPDMVLTLYDANGTAYKVPCVAA